MLTLGDDRAFVEELVLAGVDGEIIPAPEGFATMSLPQQLDGLDGQVVWQPQAGAAQVVWVLEHRSVTRLVEVEPGPGADAQLALLVFELLETEVVETEVAETALEPEPEPESPPAPIHRHTLVGVGPAWSKGGARGSLEYASWTDRRPGGVLRVEVGPQLQRSAIGVTWSPFDLRVSPRASFELGATRLSRQGYAVLHPTVHARVSADARLGAVWLAPSVTWNPVRDQLVERPDTLLVDTGRVEIGLTVGWARKVPQL
ncbi:MAG: hypothetical protein GY913_22125 [Proteobacteria bacterium]|nr:hypothetical protein [Pseudomonadota bacterium]MCP4919609.1 hypothetical protein [Pseudomonadota bacterium]